MISFEKEGRNNRVVTTAFAVIHNEKYSETSRPIRVFEDFDRACVFAADRATQIASRLRGGEGKGAAYTGFRVSSSGEHASFTVSGSNSMDVYEENEVYVRAVPFETSCDVWDGDYTWLMRHMRPAAGDNECKMDGDGTEGLKFTTEYEITQREETEE